MGGDLFRGTPHYGPTLHPAPLPLSALPHTNLPQNLPLVQNQPPQIFSVKDQHLLKPPQVLGAGNFIYIIYHCYNEIICSESY